MSFSDSITLELTPAEQTRDWAQRWKDIQRELSDLSQLRTTPMSAENIHSAQEQLHSFFITAYHLKDALKNEAATLGLKPQDVENAVTRETDLALLADLANLAKHGVLNQLPRSGHVPIFAGFSGESHGESLGWRLKLTIQHNSRTVDGLQSATDAVNAWQRVLSGWGLI